ncbi:MAG: DUF1194 domain-containing protein [Hyphomicrobiales bacterium]
MAGPMVSRRQVVGLLAVSPLVAAATAAQAVDLALVLAIDCSLSVDETEFQLQLRGTSQAVLDSAFLQVMEQGANRKIAISAFLWSNPKSQQVIVPWRILDSAHGAMAVADEILSARRTIASGATATGDALAFASRLLEQAPAAERRVVDASTNGPANMGKPVRIERDGVLALGATINGLAVGTKGGNLKRYLEENVTGGPGSFVIEAPDFNAYTLAIRLKLFREVAGSVSA